MICIASSWWLDNKEDGCLVNPTGCRRTRQPVTSEADDPNSDSADRERSRRGIRFRVPGAAPRREVLLLVSAVGAGLARPLLRRRVPQLRALPLAHRALGRRSRAALRPRPARGGEPRRGPG